MRRGVKVSGQLSPVWERALVAIFTSWAAGQVMAGAGKGVSVLIDFSQCGLIVPKDVGSGLQGWKILDKEFVWDPESLNLMVANDKAGQMVSICFCATIIIAVQTARGFVCGLAYADVPDIGD